VERETSYIKCHLIETKTSRSQIENATSYIEHHQNASKREKVWSQIGNNNQAVNTARAPLDLREVAGKRADLNTLE
jgi:hypothetical protein